MNWNYFDITGYISVVLWLCVPLLWITHFCRRPRRWLCHIALAVAMLAFVFAKINSVNYVDKIQPDRSEEMAVWEAEQDAQRKAMEDSRGEDVAKIRFAEDATGDFLDVAGMDESDRKYMEKINEPSVPDWKKDKKTRSEGRKKDDSVEGKIGASVAREGIDIDSADVVAESEPVMMAAADLKMANSIDGINLKLIRILMVIAFGIIIADYFRRINVYQEAYCPLPFPSEWVNGLTPLPAVMERPDPARRSMVEELLWLIKRGDSFLYLGSDHYVINKIPKSATRFAGVFKPVDIIRVSADEHGVNDDFVFESLWYRRGSFVVDSAARAEQLMEHFLELLRKRKATRAKVSQSVHILWDFDTPIDETMLRDFAKLGRATGISLVINKYRKS